MDDKILVPKEEYEQLKKAFDQVFKESHLSQPAVVHKPNSAVETQSESEKRYHKVFENSPLSIWEEDFSAVKALFDDLRKDGIVDIESHFSQYPEIIRKCADLVKIVDINQAALALHAAANKEELLAGLAGTFTPDSYKAFKQELISLWNGCTEMSVEASVKTLQGVVRNVTVYYSVCQGYEDSLSKVLVSLTDITERKRNEAINASRLHLIQFAAGHTVAGLLEETLNEAEKLTDSRIGFYHFVENDQQTLSLQEWSNNTKAKFCKADGKGMHYSISDAGVWVDCVKLGKAVIHNDYASLPHRKGLPEGHAEVLRELVVPVFRGEKIKAILGVGNKPVDYVEKDMEAISLLADLAWEIAERKQAEEALRKSEERFRRLAENSSDVIYRMSLPDGKYEYISPAVFPMMGYHPEEYYNDPMLFKRTILPDWHTYFEEQWANLVKGEAPPMYEYQIIHKSGEVRWLNQRNMLIWGDEGNPIAIEGIVTDITQRKQIEVELQKSEALLNITQRLSKIGGWEFCVETGKSFWTDETYLIHEIPVDSGIDHFNESLKCYTPEDRPVVKGAFHDVVEKGRAYDLELPFTTFKGKHLWIRTTAQPVYENGKIVRVIGNIMDITDRKRAEESQEKERKRMEVLLASLNTGLSLINPDMTIAWVNKKTREMFPVGEPVGRVCHVFYENRTTVCEGCGTLQAFLTGKVIESEQLVPSVGTWYNIVSLPIKDTDGRVVNVLEGITDITERKQAEQKLQVLNFALNKVYDEVFLIDENANFKYVNEQSCHTLGYSQEQLLNMGVANVDPDFPPERWAEHWKDIRQKGSLILEGRHKANNGHIYPVEISANYFEYNGCGYNLALARDITERKQAEHKMAQLAAIVKSSDDVIIGKSLDGTVTSWNKGAEKIYGYTETEIVGKSISVLAVPGYEDDIRLILEKMKRGEHLDHFETVRRKKDGQYIHMSLTVSPVEDAEGRIIGLSTIGRDITERKLAEEALRISDSRYRVAQSIGQVGNWEYNLQTTHFWGSDEAKRIYGFDPNQADFSTDEVEKCIPERERVHQALVDLIEKGREYNLEFEIHPRNSSESRIISSVAVLHRDELGNPLVVKGVIQDITKRKQAEEALHRMNRELRAVSNCNQVLVRADDEQTLLDEICRIICEEAGYRFVWVGYTENDEAKTIRPVAMSGFDSGYLALAKLTWADTPRGCGPAGVAIRSGNSVYSQDLATDPHFAFWRDNAIERGYRSAIALPLKGENASVFGVMLIYSSEISAFNPDEIRLIEELAGDLAFGITTLRTRAKRKQAEQQLSISENRLNQAQRIAHIGSWELYLVTGKLEWSDEIYRIFEIDQLQFGASYDAFLDFIHPDDREMVNQAYTQSLENKTAYDIVHRLKFPDGRIKFVHEHCITFYNDEGRPTSSLGTVQDVTERKMVEDEIQKLNRELELRVADRTAQLEAANKELESFAYSVSHDLRAPLRHIDGFVELLRMAIGTTLNAENKHFMDAISDSSKRMGALIDDLLSFSRMGRSEMLKMSVNMNQLVSDVIQEFEPDIKDRTISWQIADLPIVTGDRAMLKIVFVNLISNALKFTRTRQQAEIEIGCKHENRAEAVFYISDNGVGFDPDYAGKLFGVFQRLHRADEFEGTGIGLANVRRIINRHGGRTWAEGKVEEGATFYFTIT